MNQVTKVIHDNELYECVESELFVTFRKTELQKVPEIVPIWKGHKIPRAMWKSILSFMKQSYEQFKSETLVYLFYDVADSNPWSWWVPPQETNGMTVKSSPESKDFVEQRKQYPDTMFGTVHHHCSSSAFQSGTDEADEVNREGLHFTVGLVDNESELDLHCRITLGGLHAEIPAERYINMAPDPFKQTATITQSIRTNIIKQLHTLDVKTLPKLWADDDFTEELANVTKRIHTHSLNNHQWNSNKNTGLGRNSHQGYWSWEDEPELSTKKNHWEEETTTPLEDLADEFVFAVESDYEYEAILANYYTYHGLNNSLQRFFVSDFPDAEIRADLKKVLSDNDYSNTEEGKEMHLLVENYLQEQNAMSSGLDFTINDLIYGLGDEERTTIQHMDKEEFL